LRVRILGRSGAELGRPQREGDACQLVGDVGLRLGQLVVGLRLGQLVVGLRRGRLVGGLRRGRLNGGSRSRPPVNARRTADAESGSCCVPGKPDRYGRA